MKTNKFTKWMFLFIFLSMIGIILVQRSMDGAEEVSTPYNPTTYSELDSFISIWDTALTSGGSSANNQVTLPLEYGGIYDFTVAWGDGASDAVSSWDQSEVTHTYNSTGVYTINITGTIEGWRFADEGDCSKIVEIQQWGALRLGNEMLYFSGCENLRITATDALDLTGTTMLNHAFRSCANLGNGGNLNSWDVSNVISMYSMFEDASSFNQPLDAWNVSSVLNIARMFLRASIFNQPLDSWNVSSMIDISAMFYYAPSFNQPLNAWDVSNVVFMENMFTGASLFNQSLDTWEVSNVKYMSWMFEDASSFNQPLDAWDVSRVWRMEKMFKGAPLSTINYDAMLVGWSQLYLHEDVVFHAGNAQYSPGAAATARQLIIDTFGWTITDGGLATESTTTLTSTEPLDSSMDKSYRYKP